MEDIEIARSIKLKPITDVSSAVGIPVDELEMYGKTKAKISYKYAVNKVKNPQSKLILVTAISPTPAGEGKTTATIGLTDALCKINKKALACLREPSLGPCFGIKGGATGGGYSQIVPMEDINLHLTGDFHAITSAHNLLSALIDNHIHQGNQLRLDVNRIVWRRVVDINDRALREIIIGLGGKNNGQPRQTGFDITVASEVMAIVCLSKNIADLKSRIGNILIGYNIDGQEILAKDINAQGSMAVLLRDAIKPNLLQTLEGNPVIVHGGPFANIAHGCNSIIATNLGLGLADYVVTEAGFGADLGGEKFLDIKCRKAGLTPSAVVLVATVRALKYHGGQQLSDLKNENVDALKSGLSNLYKHYSNLTEHYGLNVVVAINKFITDTPSEINTLIDELTKKGIVVSLCEHWAKGGAGAIELAEKIVDICEQKNNFKLLYNDDLSLVDKIKAVAQKIYGAKDVVFDQKELKKLTEWQAKYGNYPVCMAKTQSSFTSDPSILGAPTGHEIQVREVRLSRGAEFVVVICGNLMTMPGLPRVPASNRIDLDEDGNIIGLS